MQDARNGAPKTVETPRASVRAIGGDDIGPIGLFLHEHLDSGIPASEWSAAIVPPWQAEAPNHGYQLRVGDRVVGAYLAYYSPERSIGDSTARFCNLAAWTVLEEFRSQGVLLLMALVKQRGYAFTDLTADRPEVAQIDRRLGFTDLDTAAYLTVNVPGRARGIRIRASDSDIEEVLEGARLEEYRDHRGIPGLHQLVAVDGGRACHIAYRVATVPLRRLGGRSLKVARILHASDPALFGRARNAITRHLVRRGILLSWSEDRITDGRPRLSRGDSSLASHRLYRGGGLADGDIDYLYSEVMFTP